MDLSKILTGTLPGNNLTRRLLWNLRWRDRFGVYPSGMRYNLYSCRICKKPVWIKASVKPDICDVTCSADCFNELVELRNEKHWS